MKNSNMVGWFEIPVAEMDRAIKFYETVFAVSLQQHEMAGELMAFFPFPEDPEAKGAGGSLVYHKDYYKPSPDGVLIYFSNEELTTELDRVEEAGGKVLQTKTLITEDIGYMALFLDTEGNRIALHSRK